MEPRPNCLHAGHRLPRFGNPALAIAADLEGSGELPRSLFAHRTLEMGDCVVANARAQREGEDLTLEDVKRLVGRSIRHATVDQRGVREALLGLEGEDPILIRRLRGSFEVWVGSPQGSVALERAESLADAISVEPPPRDTRVAVAFWSGGRGDGLFGGPEPRWRRLALPCFSEIADNYPEIVRQELRQLFNHSSGAMLPGRLALWHGPPGTGKTWALRALGREWKEWCDLHYITDPERLLGGDTAYMLAVVAGHSEPLELDEDDRESQEDRPPGERWRLLVLEDAGELLGIAAPTQVGRGFARLLNIADGLLGQGSRTLLLVTTNEPLGKLHPAALRPGRAMATLEFGALGAEEALAWLRKRGMDRPVDSRLTIAELHAILADRSSLPMSEGPGSTVGFG